MSQDVFTEAMSDMINDEDFRIDALYKGETIRVIFDNGFIVVNGVETTAPIAQCLNTDISGVNHDDTITIGGITYKIIGIQPTRNGTTRLILSEDAHG